MLRPAEPRPAARALLIAAVTLWSAPARADESPDAGAPVVEATDAGPPPAPTSPGERLYLEGVALRDAGDVDGACAKFHDALRFSPGPRAVLEEARCRRRAGDLTGALAILPDARAAAAGDDPVRDEIEQEIRALMSTTVRLVIDTNAVEKGAWVEYRIDDRTLSRPPSGQTLRVSQGKHVVRAIRPGCAQWRKQIEGTAGDRLEVSVPALRCEGLSEPVAASTAPSRRSSLRRFHRRDSAASNPYTRAAFWVGGAAGMAFLVAIGRSQSENQDAHSQAVTAGVIGGLATVTAILLYVHGRRQQNAAAKPSADVSVAPIVADDETGFVVGIQGVF